MKRALLASMVLAGAVASGCMSTVDRARLERRITILGETAALGKGPAQAAAIRSETAAIVSDVDAAIR